jgi:transposase-like protein
MKKNKRFQLLLTPSEKEDIRAAAEEMGLSMSDIIRLAVREYLALVRFDYAVINCPYCKAIEIEVDMSNNSARCYKCGKKWLITKNKT